MEKVVKKAMKILIFNPFYIPSKLICLLRSWYYTQKVDSGKGRIIIQDPFIKFKIIKGRGSSFSLLGNLIIQEHNGLIDPIYIRMGNNSILNINGDFNLGSGVRIILSDKASLIIGGKVNESASGITANTLIMVYKKITIGKDFVCAWNVFISDSDWHSIEGENHSDDVNIGDHVWIANSCSILKGVKIGDNCIVGSHSKLIKKAYIDNTMIAGIPAKVVKTEINWKRDF